MKSTYSKGRSAERLVKKKLESRGWLVRQSPGSRGPNDLYALKSGRKLLVQVKSGSASAGKQEVRRLRAKARKVGGNALVMKVKGRKVTSKFV